MKLVRHDQRFFINFSHMKAKFWFFPAIFYHPRIPLKKFLVFDEQKVIPNPVRFPIQAPSELPRTVFPTIVQRVGVRTNFVQEEPRDLQYLTKIWNPNKRETDQYPAASSTAFHWMLYCEWMDYLLLIYGMWWWKCYVRQTAPQHQPIPQQGAVGTSGEASPMAKPWFQRRRDPSTWCHAARGARGKILHRIWDIQSKGGQTCISKLLRTLLAQGDLYGRRLQEQSFKIWSTQNH